MTQYRPHGVGSSSVVFRRVCCLSTRAATLGIAAFDMFSSVATVIVLMVVMHKMGDMIVQLLNVGMWSVIMWMIVRCVLGLVTSVILIYGVVKERKMLMVPWLCTGFSSIIGGVATAVVAPLALLVAPESDSQEESSPGDRLSVIVLCIFLSFAVVGAVITFLVPFSHYQILTEREKARNSPLSPDSKYNGNSAHCDESSIPLRTLSDLAKEDDV